jgi:hypothetical protein
MASPGPEHTVEQGGLGHPRIVTALLVVATLIAFLAVFSIWVNRQALNTDNWVDTSGKLLRNDEIRSPNGRWPPRKRKAFGRTPIAAPTRLC